MRRALTSIALAATVVAACAALVSVSSGGASDLRAFENERYGFSASLPPGWHRAEKRLVPRLILPREILSVGTAPMPVGQGGNCGREPIASIRRLRPGDALITIQEYAVTERMRSTLSRSFSPRGRLSRGDLFEYFVPGLPRGVKVAHGTIHFGEHGRAFDALVYVRGALTPGIMGEVRSILAGIRFERGTFVGRGSA